MSSEELPLDQAKSLQQYILTKVGAGGSRPVPEPGSLTVGLEQEFFLLNQDRSPATHYTSQGFMTALAQLPGWSVRERCDSDLGQMIVRVSYEDSFGRYSAVKYDHHPHLMEIAFGYRPTLFALRDLAQFVLECVSQAAESTNMIVGNQPVLDVSASDCRIHSPLREFRNLRHYRTKLFEFRGEPIDYELANYAAVIAATQIHVGGTFWWDHPHLIKALYGFEVALLSLVPFGYTRSSWNELLLKRWSGYQRVFSGFPLVGFPNLDDWTISTWTEALLKSPLCGGPENAWAGMCFGDLSSNPFSNWDAFLLAVRDLQIIRPRSFGTLEFRADPALAGVENLMSRAAIRLGLCAFAMKNPLDEFSFQVSRDRWWGSIQNGVSPNETQIVELARKGLSYRPFSEDHFLSKTAGSAA